MSNLESDNYHIAIIDPLPGIRISNFTIKVLDRVKVCSKSFILFPKYIPHLRETEEEGTCTNITRSLMEF